MSSASTARANKRNAATLNPKPPTRYEHTAASILMWKDSTHFCRAKRSRDGKKLFRSREGDFGADNVPLARSCEQLCDSLFNTRKQQNTMRLFHLISIAIGSYSLASHSRHDIDVTTVVLQALLGPSSGHFLLVFLGFHFGCLALDLAGTCEGAVYFSHCYRRVLPEREERSEKTVITR